MSEPEVEMVPGQVEIDASHPPGVIQGQEFREEGDVAHGQSSHERPGHGKGSGGAILWAEQT